MYIPKKYRGEGQAAAIAFMRRFHFGLLVSAEDKRPIATHLPFITTATEQGIRLTSHLSKANSQWRQFDDGPVLAIFSEPHAYISPSFYNKEQNVPTWNYLSVHAYGRARILDGLEVKFELLEQMMVEFEPAYLEQWRRISMDYKKGLAEGIVAFEIEVEELQYKEKLSQNKQADERRRIFEAFAESGVENERLVGEYMEGKEG